MNQLVGFQVTLLSGVACHVLSQGAKIGEFLITHITRMFPDACMDQLVLIQATRSSKSLFTNITHMFLHFCMN
jgi:hypothetical protein